MAVLTVLRVLAERGPTLALGLRHVRRAVCSLCRQPLPLAPEPGCSARSEAGRGLEF